MLSRVAAMDVEARRREVRTPTIYQMPRRRPRVILVGQAPGPRGKGGHYALTGRVGGRIASLAGLRFPQEYLETFARCNLLAEWPGPAEGKGDYFPGIVAGRAALRFIEHADVAGRKVILLGRGVARAFGVPRAAWFDWRGAWVEQRGLWLNYAVIPHPSGVCTSWNDEQVTARARAFFRELLDLPNNSVDSGPTT